VLCRHLTGSNRRFDAISHAAAVAAALVLLPAAAAASPPWGLNWSEVTGELFSRTHMNRTPAIIKSVDGRNELDKVVKSPPGQRKIVVQSPPLKGFSGAVVTLDLTLEPGKRYDINAQFKSGVGTEREPVVAVTDAVPGCKVP
jgi:hypothetical protein